MPGRTRRGQTAGMNRVLRVVLPLIAAALGLFLTVVLWIWHRFVECTASDNASTMTAPKYPRAWPRIGNPSGMGLRVRLGARRNHPAYACETRTGY